MQIHIYRANGLSSFFDPHLVNASTRGVTVSVSDRVRIRKSLHTASRLAVWLVSWGRLNLRSGAAKNWNDLPYDIRACDAVNSFKRKLKAHLFNIAYAD